MQKVIPLVLCVVMAWVPGVSMSHVSVMGCDVENGVYMSDCFAPDSLMVSSIGPNTAKLTWPMVTGASDYDVTYGKINDVASAMNTLVSGVTDEMLWLSQLEAETEYYVWVRSNCGDSHSEWGRVVRFKTQVACATVENVRVTSLSHLGFAMSWDYSTLVGGTATEVEVGWKRASDANYQVQVLNQNYFIFQGLEAGTRYDVRLRTICGEDTAEAYEKRVVTSFNGMQVGTAESFNDCFPVDCSYKNNYSQMLYLASELTGLDTIGGIAFNIDYNQNGYDRTWDIYMGHISRTSLNTVDYVPLDSLTLVADSVIYEIKEGWSGVMLDTPFVYNGTSNLVIAVNDHSVGKNRSVYFYTHDGSSIVASNNSYVNNPLMPSFSYSYNDSPDIIFMQPVRENGCEAPLVAVGQVDEGSVELVWNANESANGYRVEYRLAGATDWTVADSGVVDSTMTVIALSAGSSYQFRVGMDCGEERVYSNEVGVTTVCGMVSSPYSENFESGKLNPCWVYGNKTVADNKPKCMQHALYMNYEVGGYAILPEMAVELSSLHMTFAINSRVVGSKLVVAVGENANDINSFVVIDTFATTSTEEFNLCECDFAEYWGTGRYIAFITLDKYIFIDDVLVEDVPSCGIPSDIVVSEVTTNTANVAWDNSAAGAVQWMIVYGEVGSRVKDTVYTVAAHDSYLLDNLNSNMNYEVMVYNICSDDTVGALMPVVFRTECGVVALPYYEPFDAEQVNVYHPCWHTTEMHTYGSWTQQQAPIIQNYDGAHGKVMKFGDNADMITPYIEAPINSIILSFDAKIESPVFGGDLAVGYCASTTDLSQAIYVDTVDFSNTEWGHYDISFANAPTADLSYIVFKNFGNAPQTDPNDVSFSHYYNGFIDNVMIAINNGCEKVTNVAVSNVTSNSAVITFDDASATGNYTVGYSEEHDVENITMTQDFTSTTATLANLESGTHYYIWVRKNCESGSSLWTEGPAFTTLCGAIDRLPYKENFDSYTSDVQFSISKPSTYPNHTMPSCWRFLNMSQSKNSYPQVYLCCPDSFIGYSDSAVCMMFVSGANTSVFAVLPEITTHVSMLEMSFMYRHEGTGESNGTLSLGVMTDATDTNSFVAVQTYPHVSELTSVTHNFRLDELNLGTNYTIAFRYTGSNRQRYFMSIDNVVVDVASDCVVPEDLTVGSVTSESIALSWSGVANNYNVQYKPATESTWIDAPTISGTQALLTHLNPQTKYQMRVQANCGANVSDWTEIVTATTGCGAAELPYVENFNDYEAGNGISNDIYPPFDIFNPTLPSCWNFVNMSIPTPLAFMTTASDYVNSGMCLMMMCDSLTPMYAVLPELDAPISELTLEYTYRNEGTDSRNALLELGVMLNPTDANTFRLLESMPLSNTKTEATHVFGMDNGWNDNTTYYIAFRYGGAMSHGNQYRVSIDDVKVNYSASCHKPSQMRVENITATTASVHWYDDADNYEINYRVIGESEWNSIVTMEMNYTLDNLVPHSEYEVRVRALCGNEDKSEWSNTIEFTTDCAVMTLPYNEDFTGFTLDDFDKYCWYRYKGLLDSVMANTVELTPATNGWGFSNENSIVNNGTNMWLDIWGTHIHDWSISPQISLTSATQLSFDMARKDNSGNSVWQADDEFVVLATTDDGNTWYVLKSWNGTEFPTIPLYTNAPMRVTLDLSQFDNETIRLAFYGETSYEGSNHQILIDNLEVTGSEGNNPNCDTPTQLATSDITDVKATFAWQGGASTYGLQYRRLNTRNWTMVTVNAQTLSVSGLQAGTEYEWRVRAICGEGEYSLWSDKATFVTTGEAPICSPVEYVSVSEIEPTTAIVSWFAGNEETQWELEYGEANFMLGHGTSKVVRDTECQLQDLVEGTIYDVYVRAICGEGFYSEWANRVQFTTPYDEDPEGIDGVEGEYELNIYPNPSSGATTISLSGVEGKVNIQVIDINGRMISNETIECGIDCEKRIDVAYLPQGTYFVRAFGNNINSVRKLIVR